MGEREDVPSQPFAEEKIHRSSVLTEKGGKKAWVSGKGPASFFLPKVRRKGSEGPFFITPSERGGEKEKSGYRRAGRTTVERGVGKRRLLVFYPREGEE